MSAQTANAIHGIAPKLNVASASKKLGFKVGYTSYSESRSNIVEGVEKVFESVLQLNEFKVFELTSPDLNITTDYFDSDGDKEHSTTPFSFGTLTYEWFDANGAKINDLTNTVGCSGLKTPLTLNIKIINVKAHSQYGLPDESLPETLTKSYTIARKLGVCYAKPNAMKEFPAITWLNTVEGWNSGSSKPNPANGGGYTYDFDPINGFKANAPIKFPTTGFPKARFQLVMTGAQTDYTYSVIANPNDSVKVDTMGHVTLYKKPMGVVTVKAKTKANPSIVYEYKFNPTSLWVIPKAGSGNYEWAKTQCNNGATMLTRADLTNSPRKNSPESWTYVVNHYTCAIDGSLFGEWGYTNSNSYPGSLWANENYWTNEKWSDLRQYLVNSYGGHVGYYDTNLNKYVACRG
ncbi:hypothetical protein RCS94_01955 [Orbaceae bacterium ac157xtp]